MQDKRVRAAFIGLGVMGYPMAGYLARVGLDTVVFNRTTAKAQAWVEEFGGRHAATPEDAARDADIVFCCVGNDDDVREVILGDKGALAGIAEGGIVVDHTTASATIAREIHALAKERGVNQICIAGVVQGLAEGLHFAACAGLDPAVVIESISKGAAQSWQMDNRWKTMVAGEFEFGFAVDWMRKDLALTLDEARHNGAHLEMTELVDRYYAEVQAMGGNRWDTSSLIARLRKV